MVLTSPQKEISASCPHRVRGNHFVVCARESLSGDSDAQNSGVVRAYFRGCCQLHQHRPICKAQHYFSAQSHCPGTALPPALCCTCILCRMHARWPNGSGISRRERP